MLVTENEQKLFDQLVEMADTNFEAAEYIEKSFAEKNFKSAISILENIPLMLTPMIEILDRVVHRELTPKQHIKAIQNIINSTASALDFYEKGNLTRALTVIRLEIVTVSKALKDYLYFSFSTLTDEKKLLLYNKNRELYCKELIRNGQLVKYKYDVSILVTGYNQLQYTKQAIESIYKYTDFQKYRVEIITLNHGSSDGTEEYFENLQNEKKINLKYNFPGYTIWYKVFEGKYVIYVSNDVVVTEGWLEKLINGMEADKDVFFATPVCNGETISNNQGVSVPYKNGQNLNEFEMQKFAKAYNLSNNSKWKPAPNLMPFLSIQRNIDYYELMKYDCRYYLFQFSDDDICTFYRRLGLKMAIATDTFVHHYGSITLGDGAGNQAKSDELNEMRRVFYDKWSVDAWESRFYFPEYANAMDDIDIKAPMNLLFIETKFGYGVYDIINKFKSKSVKISKMEAVVVNPLYEEDAKGICDKVYAGGDVISNLKTINEKYNFIFLGDYLSNISPQNEILALESAFENLATGGYLMFSIENIRNTNVILDFILNGGKTTFGENMKEYNGMSADALYKRLKNHACLKNVQKVELRDGSLEKSKTHKELIKFTKNILSGEVSNQDLNNSFSCVRTLFLIENI